MCERDYPYEACKDNKDCIYLTDTGKCLFHKIAPTIVAVDLDGTLAKFDEWNGHDDFGERIEKSKKLLERTIERITKDKGMRPIVVLHTTRNKKYADLEGLLKRIGLYKYVDFINRNPFDPPDTSSNKMYADVYFDDRAVHFDEGTDPEEAVEEASDIW